MMNTDHNNSNRTGGSSSSSSSSKNNKRTIDNISFETANEGRVAKLKAAKTVNETATIATAAAAAVATTATAASHSTNNESNQTTANNTAQNNNDNNAAEEKCPKDLFMEKIQAFVEENNLKGYMLTRGVSRRKNQQQQNEINDQNREDNDDSEEDDDNDNDDNYDDGDESDNDSNDDDDDSGRSDDDEDFDESKYTAQDMETARFIMIDTKRDQALTIMRNIILGDSANSMVLSFNTSFAYDVLSVFDRVVVRSFRNRKVQLSDMFNVLFAYTFLIAEFNSWMVDNEGGVDEMVQELARMWKKLLKNTDQVLGIDSEYTRPGIIALLEDFKEQIENVECYDDEDSPFEFNFE